MHCELKSRFRHSRFTFLHELRTYLCSFGFTKIDIPLSLSLDYHSQMYDNILHL
jgi:hypothetical protein